MKRLLLAAIALCACAQAFAADVYIDWFDPVTKAPFFANNVKTVSQLNVSAGTANQTGADQTNYNWRGVKVYTNLSVNAGGLGSITVNIQFKDPISAQYVTVLSSAAITAVGTTILTVYPGMAATANVSANDVLPDAWRVTVTANNANPTSYTVSACGLF